jgi:hypothetical protein
MQEFKWGFPHCLRGPLGRSPTVGARLLLGKTEPSQSAVVRCSPRQGRAPFLFEHVRTLPVPPSAPPHRRRTARPHRCLTIVATAGGPAPPRRLRLQSVQPSKRSPRWTYITSPPFPGQVRPSPRRILVLSAGHGARGLHCFDFSLSREFSVI